MKTTIFKVEGINLKAECVGGKTLEEYLDVENLQEALSNQKELFEGAIEEGIADSLIYDSHYAPEWYKAQMQNIDAILPNKEVRDYVVSLITK